MPTGALVGNLTSRVTAALGAVDTLRPGLALNPRADLRWKIGTRGVDFSVLAPVRGKSLRKTQISPESMAVLHRFCCALLENDAAGSAGLQKDALDELEQTGVLLPNNQIPDSVSFVPRLRDEDIQAMTDRLPTPASLNAAQMEHDLFGRETVNDHEQLAWVHDAARDADWPCWLDADQMRTLSAAISSQQSDRTQAWHTRLADARTSLDTHGYAIVRDLVPTAFLISVQDYYRRLLDNGYLLFDGTQPLRYYLHNEPLARWLHHHTLPIVARAIPEPVKCSYCFLGFYVPGAVLERHLDREQCEYTLSLAVDAMPSRNREDAWPLYADLSDGSRVEALLAPGDGLIFKGRELAHYRDELPPGRSSSSIFLHYVPVDFSGSLN